MNRAILAIFAILLVFGCGDDKVEKANQLIEDGETYHYLITTLAYTKDQLGVTLNVSGYRIYFYHQELEDGTDYIDFYDIQFADAAESVEDLEWYYIPKLDRLEISVPDGFDIYRVTDELNDFPHDSLESYYVYTSLIDVLAFDSHKNVFLEELVDNNQDTFIMEPLESSMPDWAPVITDIDAYVAETHYLRMSDDGDRTFFYKNDIP